ncbi:methyltransferase domain-containing protein [Constrictibacter sp. MBR-5]|uniref:class I SAM-dependent methyltransferase n=1 Tax=Constrictibacter sp. MBR-5 TaxID=3156467 RepID=UPI0033922100
MNDDAGAWAVGLLEVGPADRVLEIGFGPGVALKRLSGLVTKGRIAGVDVSTRMMAQAKARNAAAIRRGRVELHRGVAESLPFAEASFEKVLAVNSVQVWSDAAAGLAEVRRILVPGGQVALCFTRHAGQREEDMVKALREAGFSAPRLMRGERAFCVLATRP